MSKRSTPIERCRPVRNKVSQGRGSAGVIVPIPPVLVPGEWEHLSLAEIKQRIERFIWNARIDSPFWGVGGRLWVPLRDVDLGDEVVQALRAHGFTVFDGIKKLGKLGRKKQVGFIVCLPPGITATRSENPGQAGGEDGTGSQPISDSTSPTLRFRRRGDQIVVEPSGDKKTAIANTYKILSPLAAEVRSIVRSRVEKITVKELRKYFADTVLKDALLEGDWQLFIDEFTSKCPPGIRNILIGVLSRRTGLSLQSVSTYLKASKRRKKASPR